MGARPKINLPRREFITGAVHYAGPFVRKGEAVMLCGATGVEKRQLRVRAPLNCLACERLAAWVWSHRLGYGFGEIRRKS